MTQRDNHLNLKAEVPSSDSACKPTTASSVLLFSFLDNDNNNNKRAFNLLKGVNQGCGLLLARDLEKREPWLTPWRRLNVLLL